MSDPRRALLCVLVMLVLPVAMPVQANGEIASYRSRNFLVHTDDEPAKARALLERLERMLGIIAAYWKRPNRQIIECCVVKDLKAWPPDRLPPRALERLRQRAGITISVKRMRGKAFVTKSLVYATADNQTTQHEAVHAFAHQMFGTSGPVWYSEGMAEMGKYWESENDRSVRAKPAVIRYLQSTPPPALRVLTRSGKTADSWQNYAQRWALCHLLANNPNYGQRFRLLGLGLLSQRPGANYRSVFGSMDREISFEFRVFLKDLAPGYRVDLCAWDWKTRFRRPRKGRTSKVTVDAGRGWQASRLTVQAGRTYSLTTSGTWQLGSEDKPVDANGDKQGRGKLQAVILDDYRLTATAGLGTKATFRPSQDGKLFLRCGDDWGSLADNSGRITVSVTLDPKSAESDTKPPNNRR